MTLAHIGTFDIESYGDLLFPLVLERRMATVTANCVHISPKGSQPIWQDCLRTMSISDLSEIRESISAVVLGGGHIIRAHPTSMPFYASGSCDGLTSYPSLWLGAAAIAMSRDVPLCWNAPGVPRRFSTRSGHLVRCATSAAEYLAVRDRRSHDLLSEVGVRGRINIVPDTALEVSRLWSRDKIDDAYKNAFAKNGRKVPERSVAIHVKTRYVSEPAATLAARIDRIAQTLNATAILIAISPCHGDIEIQRLVAKYMASVPLLVEPRGLCEIAACIGRSRMYVGSSLHGMITAFSFKTPAGVVADEDAAGFGKFTGFLEQVGLIEVLCESWECAEKRLDYIQHVGQQNKIAELAWAKLDDHWATMQAAVLKDETKRARDLTGNSWRKTAQRMSYSEPPGMIGLRIAPQESKRPQSEMPGDRRPQQSAVLEGIHELAEKVYIPSIDLIICVHNALADVQLCLDSVHRNTGLSHRLYIVNDGSDKKTTDFLRAFSATHGSTLLENRNAKGYTRAANMALRASASEYVILLNSDTVVPHRWIERLLECIESYPDVGIVSPLSNAAGWQSVPKVFDDNGDWMVNELPEGVTTDIAATIVQNISLRQYPKVPFLNGFCLLMKRDVIARIGYFDAESFPDGYGEEVDFCLRAGRAGVEMAIADHNYIFHSKSSSYGHERRKKLTVQARVALQAKYGAATISAARETLRNSNILSETRRRIAEKFEICRS